MRRDLQRPGHHEGAYHVLVSLDPSRRDPTIVFSVMHDAHQDIVAEKLLDYVEFLTEQFARYNDHTLNRLRINFSQSAEDRDLRESWRIESLRELFSDLLEGDREFWHQFNHGFEKIMWPLTREMLTQVNSPVLELLAEGPSRR